MWIVINELYYYIIYFKIYHIEGLTLLTLSMPINSFVIIFFKSFLVLWCHFLQSAGKATSYCYYRYVCLIIKGILIIIIKILRDFENRSKYIIINLFYLYMLGIGMSIFHNIMLGCSTFFVLLNFTVQSTMAALYFF